MTTVLITGSRDWTDRQRIDDALRAVWIEHRSKPNGRELIVIHGGARGADSIAGDIARRHTSLGVVERVYPARWSEYGRRAGRIRNQQMVDMKPDLCLAFIKDGSPGATHCAERAEAAGIPVIYYIETTPVPRTTDTELLSEEPSDRGD